SLVGRGPALTTAAACAALWDFFFLPPRYTLILTHAEDIMMIGMFFVVAFALGHLVTRIRWQERAERRREERATALYLLTRDLADAADSEDMTARLARQVEQAFHAQSALLLRDGQTQAASTLTLSAKEQTVAEWVVRNGRVAGKFSDTLPTVPVICVPLTAKRGVLGALAVEWKGPEPTLEQRDLLDAFARQAALVLDRIQLGAEAETARLTAESEKLSKALLNSISHELRTPISAITTAVSGLAEGQAPDLQRTLTAEIQESAGRLNRLVSNLLDMTRLESGKVKPRLDWCDVGDLIDVTLRRNERELARHPVTVRLQRPLPLVRMDFVLIEQALNNLLLNAAAYTPAGTGVEVKAGETGGELALSVGDRGPGLPADSLGHLFNKFYRAPGSPAGGTGLGLSIVKGFVEAHGGRVAAQNRPGGGAEFTIYLPVEPAPALETAA
ncbi:MAG TPA: ATP-binding protein, partial [Verrucomicrobiae bacterium]|nr:ATP-binding protein [Verrucomicrobiae bacterium]